MATLESKKAATLGKRSIIGMILGLALGAILCFVPNGYIRDDIVINTISLCTLLGRPLMRSFSAQVVIAHSV